MEDVKLVRSGWINIFRPWSLHGAVIPILIGGVIAYYDNFFNWQIFILIMASSILLQSAANILNTYGDYIKGTDTRENQSRSPELVSGTLNPDHVKMGGILCLFIAALIGIALIWYGGAGVLIFGLIGLAGASLYTIGVAYKYYGLGLIMVFLMMGILMPLGTYYVLTGELNYEVFLISLPNAFLITAVLSGNETRDYHEDKKFKVGTFSSHLSHENSTKLYLALNIIAFPILAIIIIAGIMPLTGALAFITLFDLYLVIKNSKKANTDEKSNRMLVPLTFNLNWHFGLLLMLGYILAYII